MMRTKQGLDFFKYGIRALALFQLYLAYLIVLGAGFGFETLDFSTKATGALMLFFLTYLLWITSVTSDLKIRIRVALGIVLVGLLPLLPNLPELIMGKWVTKDWILLGYFLTGSGAMLDMYWKEVKNED